MTEAAFADTTQAVAVVGGAGFVGCNLADAYASEGARVRVIDNLSRPGSEKNLDWLKRTHGDRVDVRLADVRDGEALSDALDGARAIFHMAAQVAVTRSIADPREDFLANAAGTFNILEFVRTRAPSTPLIFASTNKVYGCLDDIPVHNQSGRHEPKDRGLAARGVDEQQALSLQTPYACSKGAADQYVLDYARTFELRASVFRMSCIYGPRQFGNEDQGWVAHFALCALRGEPLRIYGDGAQVRDVLHVQDAVRAYRAALERIDILKGEAFNLGGGAPNAVSLQDVIGELRALLNAEIFIDHGDWRKGDQPWFVADTRKLAKRLEWRASINWREGLRDLVEWLRANAANSAADDENRESAASGATRERLRTA